MTSSITRRDFVKTGAAVAGAVALGQLQGAHAGEFTGRIKKAVKFGMIQGDFPAEEKLKMIKDIGFDGVEPTMGDKVDPAELRRASEATGVPIHGVVNGSVDNIPAAIDRAKMYGSTSVLLVAGRVNESMPYEENYVKTQAIIREAIPYAEKQEILLLVENVWNNFLLSPLEMRQYIDELDSPWVGVYLDIGNMVRFGYPEHWIPVLGPRVRKLDIKEYSRDKQMNEGLWKGFDAPIGEGSIDWAAVRRELKAIDYQGWATAEVNGGDRAHLTDVAARMNKVLDL